MSEASDLYSSSLYEENIPNNLTYPLSDIDPQLFSPELSFSQQSNGSTPNPEFRQPLIIPSSLERVGPKRVKQYVLYKAMNRQDFIEWWIQTQHGGELNKLNTEEKEKVKWDGDGLSSDVWQHFHQVAHKNTGEPKVMCKRCGKILNHPHSSGHGTNAMKRHWEKTKACNKASTTNQVTLSGFLQKQVS